MKEHGKNNCHNLKNRKTHGIMIILDHLGKAFPTVPFILGFADEIRMFLILVRKI